MLNEEFIIDDNAEIRTLFSEILSSVNLETKCFTDSDNSLLNIRAKVVLSYLTYACPR